MMQAFKIVHAMISLPSMKAISNKPFHEKRKAIINPMDS